MEVYKPEHKSHEDFETWLNAFKLKLKMHTLIIFILALVLLILFTISVSIWFQYNTDVAIRSSVSKSLYKLWPQFRLSLKMLT